MKRTVLLSCLVTGSLCCSVKRCPEGCATTVPTTLYKSETLTVECTTPDSTVLRHLNSAACEDRFEGTPQLLETSSSVCNKAAVDFVTGTISVHCIAEGKCAFNVPLRRYGGDCVCDKSDIHIDKCALGPCESTTTCKVVHCVAPPCNPICTPCEYTCKAIPQCNVDEHGSDVPCTVEQLQDGLCRVTELCCSRLYCRPLWAPSAQPCAVSPCGKGEICNDTPMTCLTQPCPQYRCVPEGKICCQAYPTCPENSITSKTPCTEVETLTGQCSRVAMCCAEVFCRSGKINTVAPVVVSYANPCHSEVCPVNEACIVAPKQCFVPPCPQHSCVAPCCAVLPHCDGGDGYAESLNACSSAEFASGECKRVSSCCVTKVCRRMNIPRDDCATQPCGAGKICSTDVLCIKSPCFQCAPLPDACCEAIGTCGSWDESDTPCLESELQIGVCRRSAICCTELFCRQPSINFPAEEGKGGDDVPVFAWVLVSVGVVMVFAAVAAGLYIKKASAADTTVEHSDSSSMGTTKRMSVASLSEMEQMKHANDNMSSEPKL